MKTLVYAVLAASGITVGFDLASLAFDAYPHAITRQAWVVVLDVIFSAAAGIWAAALLWQHRDE